MVRVALISTLGLLGAVAASAGSIQIGGASGITSNYINQGGGAVCAAGPGLCVTGSTGGWIERNYDTILFAGATNGVTPPVPFTGYQQTGGEASGLTATSAGNAASPATGVKFAMLSDGTTNGQPTGNSSNFWEAGSANSTMTVPIGVFDVTDVATMLQNVWGTLGGNDTNITFNFGSSSNATSGLTSVTFDLLNSNNQNGAGANGEIRAGVACTTTTTALCNSTTNPHNVPLVTTTLTATNSNTYGFGSAYIYGTASTGGTYPYTTGGTNMYANTAGLLKLDDQDFVFGNAFANMWLVSVAVSQNGAFGINSSATALSAITVDSAVPEPTTILLVLAGLGGIGAARRFRRS